ncbi:MAG: maleylpyruvate isomerase family mycothiol-dependent enzyme [Mycobacteriaceae bacterium]
MTNIHSRLLLAERDSLLPLLRRTPEAAFDLPTVCTQWSVRDVIAHCASALIRVVTGTEHSFSPADNQGDVDERKGWPLSELLGELQRAYALAAAAPSVARIAFGEWVHGGDIREALGEPDAYASPGVEDALVILSGYTARLGLPPTDAHLSDRPELGVLRLGDPDARALGQLRTSTAGVFRVTAHRRPELAVDELVGVTLEDLRVFS